ncbi:hypothetical protein [Neptuniibacter sp. QD37_11]|uniref:hypothetical protein n=1 Tax=Neptuniibacter sp. QD37_11 TaxID=3398209 RepID=UPI0039F57CF0
MKKFPFTVISFYPESGQVVCDHVEASCSSAAFTVVAKQRESVEFVVGLPGHLSEEDGALHFPGESLVDAEIVLDQPEVFGTE